MTFAKRGLTACWAVAVVLSGGVLQAAQEKIDSTREGLALFESKIRPALVRHCYECHSGDPAKAKGNFVLDTRDGLRKGGPSGAAIVPGHPDESLLIEAIRYEGLEMPPKEHLPEELIADFATWVELGAPDPRGKPNARGKINLADARKWWSFQRPKSAPAPQVYDASWPKSDIDKFLLARLEAAGLKPVADADRATLIRRATFDLTGLPPTPEEVDAFVNDPSADAFAAVVDRLLVSPQFGERWGRHWLDLARFGESTGKERNVPYHNAWRYRNWVIDAFNADMPYDQFIVAQLAGDLLPQHGAAQHNSDLIATGFLAIGPKGLNEKNREQYQMDVVDDQIDATSRAFLGLTVACARCHDHKFDPIPTTDYYALAGIFRSTETLAGVQPGKDQNGADRFLLPLADETKPAKAAVELRAEQARQQQRAAADRELAELQARLKKLGKPAKSPGQKKNPQNRIAQAERKQLRERIQSLEARLAELGTSPGYDGPQAMGVRDSATPADCQVLVRGEVKEKGPTAPRGVLTVLKNGRASRINPAHSGRLELARWIASKDNPLTARVAVNRIWQHLFGQGLVETVDNFGALGDEPSHPELLDALAVQFMEDHWSTKRLIRAIVLSRSYQLGSQHDAKNYGVDPANKLIWRMERRRLDAEEIRDAMLAASGQLDLARPAGSPLEQFQDSEMGKQKDLSAIRQESNVRSVYLPLVRGFVPQSLAAFDMADPSLIVGKREVTTVATQALYMLNNPFVLRQSEQMARRLLGEKELDPPGRATLAYRLALGRAPSDEEQSRVLRFLNDYRKTVAESQSKTGPVIAAWTSVCQTLFASGEFRYLY